MRLPFAIIIGSLLGVQYLVNLPPPRQDGAIRRYIVALKIGRFAEWLGAGLQNQLQRFESATDLHKIPCHAVAGDFSCLTVESLLS